MSKANILDKLKAAILPGGGKMFDWGDTVPTDTTAGYAKGALFFKTDGAAGAILYVNEGTKTSCAFKAQMSGANIATLIGGSVADALHTHNAAGLAVALQDVIPSLTLTGTNDGDGTGTMDIQAKDAAGNNLAQRFLVRTWIANAEFSEPDAQTDFSVTTGEEMVEVEADADYEVICDTTGKITMNIDTAADKTVYVMAEIDGRIYTGSVAITGN